MSQNLTQQQVNTFVAGLITEASELSYPPNSSVDELNCELNEDGSRQRRYGINIEDSAVASPSTVDSGDIVVTSDWTNVAERGDTTFLVLQIADKVYIYDKAMYPVSGSYKSYSFDLSTVNANNGVDIVKFPIQTTVVHGKLIIVHPAIDPVLITYDPDTDSFSSEEMPDPKVRDFEWQGDTSTYFKDSSSPSNGRKYDTYNASWTNKHTGAGSNPLNTFIATTGDWPALTHPWYTAADVENRFDPAEVPEWQRFFAGTTLTGNGRFILNLFSKDRQDALYQAEGVSIPIDVETTVTRFACTTTHAGRAWFSGLGDSKVYFSKVVEDIDDIAKFYQLNDPTAQDFSDLLDSDGGVILIAEAQRIKRLYSFNSSILVFAENGVWQISGPDGIFKATEYSVRKVSSVGLYNPRTFVDVEGIPFWWSKFGIHTITLDQVSQQPQEVSLSKSTIQTLFDGISIASRIEATVVYDRNNKVVQWLYSNDVTDPRKYNRAINLDVSLQAFYPWEFENESGSTNYVIEASFFEGYQSNIVSEVVTVNGVTVTSGGSNVVADNYAVASSTVPRIIYVTRDESDDSWSFAHTDNYNFLDWGTTEYSSYVEAAFNFMSDMTSFKYGLYITSYMKVTETGWTGDETSGYSLVAPSSLLLKTYWDLRNSPSISAGQQIYRLRRLPVVDTGDLNNLNYPYDTIISKTKVRGRGRTVKCRWESEGENDWHLIGYELLGLQNQGL